MNQTTSGKRNQKWVLSALLTAALSSTVSCAPFEPKVMQIKPGVEGTFVAIGAETDLSVQGEGEAPGSVVQFEVKKVDSSGLSIGTSTGVEGEEPKNEKMYFIPASVTKVVTAVMALKALGPAYRYTTEIRWAPGESAEVAKDLIVIADGDPQTGRENEADGPSRARIRELVQKLKDQGVQKIVGKLRLVSADPRKDRAAAYDGYQPEDYISCYGAISQTFNYRRNCASFVVTDKSEAKWGDSNVVFPFKLSIQSGKRASLIPIPQFGSPHLVSSYLIEGTWGSKSKDEWLTLPVSETKAWFGNTLLSEMSKQGIEVSGVKTILPQGEEELELLEAREALVSFVRVESDPMSDLIRLMNKPSDNFLADSIFKALANKYSERDIQKASARAVHEGILDIFTKAGQPELAKEIVLFDGAGLTRNNRVTPRAFLMLLKEFSRDALFPALWESLPIAGVDGTLKNRMKGSEAEGKARAKTGTLKGAYQLAGYIPRFASSGEIKEYVPFVILSATTPDNKTKVRDFQDKLVARLMKTVNEK